MKQPRWRLGTAMFTLALLAIAMAIFVRWQKAILAERRMVAIGLQGRHLIDQGRKLASEANGLQGRADKLQSRLDRSENRLPPQARAELRQQIRDLTSAAQAKARQSQQTLRQGELLQEQAIHLELLLHGASVR